MDLQIPTQSLGHTSATLSCGGQAFHRLPDNDKTTLAEEMARTGIPGQSYSTTACEGGPAFLVREIMSCKACMSCIL